MLSLLNGNGSASFPLVYISAQLRFRSAATFPSSLRPEHVMSSCGSQNSLVEKEKAVARRVLLELHAPGLSKEDSVRVSGSVPELGEWNVHRSKPLCKREG